MDLIPRGWVTTEQAQRMTGYSESHLRNLARDGAIQARKTGQNWLFDQASLMKYYAAARPGPKALKRR